MSESSQVRMRFNLGIDRIPASLQGRQLSDGTLQLDALDGLRGFAVLMVILAHTGNAGFHLLPPLDFSGAGHVGVFLFFGLSAFLLTNAFAVHGDASFSRTSLLRYFERRFLRIYPLYFLYVTAAVLSTWLLTNINGGKPTGIPMAMSESEYLRQIFMVEGKGITWSIPVEFHYYFMLPFVAYAYCKLCKCRIVPVIALTTLALVAISMLRPLQDAASLRSVVYHLPVFLLGSVSAVLHQRWINSSWTNRVQPRVILEWFGIAALIAAMLMTPSILKMLSLSGAFKPHRQFLLFAILWAVVIFATIHGNGYLGRLFRISWLRYLGFISFSAYLFHPVFISALAKTGLSEKLGPAISGWMVLLLTVISAYASFLIVEKPISQASLLRRQQQ